MVIGIDASRANLENKTGIEFYSYFLIQELKKIIGEPHQVILYSPEPLRDDLANLPVNWQYKEIKTPIKLPIGNLIGAGPRIKKRPFLWTQLGLSLEMLRRPPDVLFVPSHALPFICPKNSSVTIHDIGFDRYPESYHRLARMYHRLVTRFAVWRAKKIITISEFTKKELVDVYGARPEKIVAIPNGYDTSRFYKRDANLRIHANDPYIFYVGRLEKKKNLPTLIKSFEILSYKLKAKSYKLVLAGSPAYGFAEIEQAIKQSSVRDRIKILNYVPSEDLPALMSGAAVFVFPSLYEGFGIPMLEAMACGVPVVASDIPALREVINFVLPITGPEAPWALRARSVDNSAAIFANPTDPDDFAQKIHQVLTDENLRQVLIARGLEHAKKFSWDKTARKVAQILTR